MDGETSLWVDGRCTNGWMGGWRDGQMGWADNGWMGGWLDGWTDRWVDGQIGE